MAFLATLPAIVQAIGVGVSVAGTIAAGKAQQQQYQQQAAAAEMQGKVAKQSAEYQAAQVEAKGKEEQAEARQVADQHRRNKQLALSSLQTRAAGSGFSASDPTTMQIADEIERYGTLQEQMAMWGGKSRRAGLEASAAGDRWSGDSAYRAGLYESASLKSQGAAAKKASYFDAGSTILGGVSDLYTKYAPKPAPTTPQNLIYGGPR